MGGFLPPIKWPISNGRFFMNKYSLLGLLLALLAMLTVTSTTKIGPKIIILFGEVHDNYQKDLIAISQQQRDAFKAFFRDHVYEKPTRTMLYLEATECREKDYTMLSLDEAKKICTSGDYFTMFKTYFYSKKDRLGKF
jgi:hypothetical protein